MKATALATFVIVSGLSFVSFGMANDVSQQDPANAAAHPGHVACHPAHCRHHIAAAADTLFSGPNRVLFTASLVDGVDDPNAPDELDDFFVLDVRASTDYCAGHINGALNIPFEKVAKSESLAQLPTDKPILVVCYTGQKAAQAMSVLNVLGYDAWSLHFGMIGWRDSTPMKVGSSTGSPQTIYGAGLPTVACQP